jgi:large subunit ribosomal protein L13
MKKNIHKLDATNQTFGRFAAKVSLLLRGKLDKFFKPNLIKDFNIEIFNLSKMKFTGKKLVDKQYMRHSGYPGGLKSISLGNFFKTKPEELFKKTVYNMLPKNKNRRKLISKLKFIK